MTSSQVSPSGDTSTRSVSLSSRGLSPLLERHLIASR